MVMLQIVFFPHDIDMPVHFGLLGDGATHCLKMPCTVYLEFPNHCKGAYYVVHVV